MELIKFDPKQNMKRERERNFGTFKNQKKKNKTGKLYCMWTFSNTSVYEPITLIGRMNGKRHCFSIFKKWIDFNVHINVYTSTEDIVNFRMDNLIPILCGSTFDIMNSNSVCYVCMDVWMYGCYASYLFLCVCECIYIYIYSDVYYN